MNTFRPDRFDRWVSSTLQQTLRDVEPTSQVWDLIKTSIHPEPATSEPAVIHRSKLSKFWFMFSQALYLDADFHNRLIRARSQHMTGAFTSHGAGAFPLAVT